MPADSSFPHVLGGNPVRAVRAASTIVLLRSEFDAGFPPKACGNDGVEDVGMTVNEVGVELMNSNVL